MHGAMMTRRTRDSFVSPPSAVGGHRDPGAALGASLCPDPRPFRVSLHSPKGRRHARRDVPEGIYYSGSGRDPYNACMKTIGEVAACLESTAPVGLAEDWDNVGLLTGDPTAAVRRLMTCLTLTPTSAQEAIDRGADLVVTHHPLPFRPLKRITTDIPSGRMLWDLTRAGVAIYSPHTAFDSARDGINQQLAELLELTDIQPLIATEEEPTVGTGRWGRLRAPHTVEQVAGRLRDGLREPGRGPVSIRGVRPSADSIEHLAVACGSAGQFLDQARAHGCDALVTGETSFHTCLEAEAYGVGLVLVGHFASERFAVVKLAARLRNELTELEEVWASESERDPIDLL